jgi:flap endonuclease-1
MLFLTVCRVARKEEVAEEKKKKGGIHIPEEWPWEEAKKLFEEPDVTPADQMNVRVYVISHVYAS